MKDLQVLVTRETIDRLTTDELKTVAHDLQEHRDKTATAVDISLGLILGEARRRFPANQMYGRWVEQNFPAAAQPRAAELVRMAERFTIEQAERLGRTKAKLLASDNFPADYVEAVLTTPEDYTKAKIKSDLKAYSNKSSNVRALDAEPAQSTHAPETPSEAADGTLAQPIALDPLDAIVQQEAAEAALTVPLATFEAALARDAAYIDELLSKIDDLEQNTKSGDQLADLPLLGDETRNSFLRLFGDADNE